MPSNETTGMPCAQASSTTLLRASGLLALITMAS